MTDTVDYALVLEGEVWAILDDTETLLRAGDVLIQRGTYQPGTTAAIKSAASPSSSSTPHLSDPMAVRRPHRRITERQSAARWEVNRWSLVWDQLAELLGRSQWALPVTVDMTEFGEP